MGLASFVSNHSIKQPNEAACSRTYTAPDRLNTVGKRLTKIDRPNQKLVLLWQSLSACRLSCPAGGSGHTPTEANSESSLLLRFLLILGEQAAQLPLNVQLHAGATS